MTATGSEQALRWIGDLDHEFYDDERNRFVWYEASAIAFQLFLFANIALVGAMLWIGGAGAYPYAIPLFVVNFAVAVVAISYAKRKYAEYTPTTGDFRSGRMRVYLGLTLFMGGGFARAAIDGGDGVDSFGFADAAGFAFGLVSAGAILFGLNALMKRRQGATLAVEDEDF